MKKENVNIRIAQVEKHELDRRARKKGMTISQYIRYKCLYEEDNDNMENDDIVKGDEQGI